MDEESVGVVYCSTEEEARELVSHQPKGTVFGDLGFFPVRFRKLFDGWSGDKDRLLKMLVSRGSIEKIEISCYDALHGAGVFEDYRVAPAVLDWVGEQDTAWMREAFGQNWETLAAYEYCVHHFPASSLAVLAAEIQLAHFLTFDDFTAGYLTKQFETIYFGTEAAAKSATELRKKAGTGGGLASRERRISNLEILIDEIEKLGGATDLFAEQRIVEQAIEAAREREPSFPKTKKTLDEYGTALRSEEPFKSRYEAVFRKNA